MLPSERRPCSWKALCGAKWKFQHLLARVPGNEPVSSQQHPASRSLIAFCMTIDQKRHCTNGELDKWQ